VVEQFLMTKIGVAFCSFSSTEGMSNTSSARYLSTEAIKKTNFSAFGSGDVSSSLVDFG
jgi:hypothetical protein